MEAPITIVRTSFGSDSSDIIPFRARRKAANTTSNAKRIGSKPWGKPVSAERRCGRVCAEWMERIWLEGQMFQQTTWSGGANEILCIHLFRYQQSVGTAMACPHKIHQTTSYRECDILDDWTSERLGISRTCPIAFMQ